MSFEISDLTVKKDRRVITRPGDLNESRFAIQLSFSFRRDLLCMNALDLRTA